jgi:hypothetical protein
VETFADTLALDPPAQLMFRSGSPSDLVRFNGMRHLRTGADFWKNWTNEGHQWAQRGRYAGSGINPGTFFSRSKQAADDEMRFYSHGAAPQDSAQLVLLVKQEGILNLTEIESLEFVFEELLNLPYRRRTVQFALLASLSRQGNLLTDYIGGWAYHKGFAGVLFLSARALEPFRGYFDSSTIEEGWGNYWTSMADELDYFTFEILQGSWTETPRRYQNMVYFDGIDLVRNTKRARVLLPDGNAVSYKNPLFGLSRETTMRWLDVETNSTLAPISLNRMEKLHLAVARFRDEFQKLIDQHSTRKLLNQQFGEELEYLFDQIATRDRPLFAEGNLLSTE